MMMLQNAISVLQMISSAIKVFGYFFCSQSWHAVEQIAKLTVIWDPMALIWSHCNDNAAKCDFSMSSPIKVFGYFFCSQSWHAVEQIVKRMVISNALMLMCRHCNDNVAKRDLSNGRLTHRHG